MAHIDSETWTVFVDDAERMLAGVEAALLALDRDSTAKGQLDALFRELHTLKGSAGLVGLSAVTRLAHTAEDLVDEVRHGAVPIHAGIIDTLLNARDLLRVIIEDSGDGAHAEHDERVEKLCAQLSAFSAGNSPAPRAPIKVSIADALAASQALVRLVDNDDFTPPALAQQAADHLQILTDASVALGIDAYSRAFDALRAALEASSPSVVRAYCRLAHRQLEAAETAGTVLFDEAPASSGWSDPATATLFFAALTDALRPLFDLGASTDPTRAARVSASTVATLVDLMECEPLQSRAADLDRRAQAFASDPVGFKESLESLLAKLSVVHDDWSKDVEDPSTAGMDVRLLLSRTKDTLRTLSSPVDCAVKAPMPTATAAGADAELATTKVSRSRFLRIQFEKVQHLMALTGEIGMAVGDVINLPALDGMNDEDVRAKVDRVEALIRELQDSSASLGLVPLSSAFNRMNRLARNLARETGKKFRFEIEGGDTEIDKLLVDALHDPLVHLLRNSVDHGLESPEDRSKAGKPEVAKLSLTAHQQGEHAIITLSDDGRGMNRELIVARAVEQDLVTSDGAQRLSDSEVWSLAFHAGLSTARRVSNLSGRGVGLDVVRDSIHALGGQVSIRSSAGVGTTIRIQLPLTLAFLDGMVVRVGASMYVIPVSSVGRVFRVEEGGVVSIDAGGSDLVRVGERLVPTLDLDAFFSGEGRGHNAPVGGLVVVVRLSDGELAIPIDELVGNEQVTMKPLVGHLANIRGSSGCGLLRNGGIAIALNCDRLRELRHDLSV